MEKMTVDGVKIEYEKGLASDEVEGIARTEIIAWQEKGKKLAIETADKVTSFKFNDIKKLEIEKGV